MEQDIDLITECFQNFQNYQIQICAYRHPIFKDYLIEPTAERHFKHLWNEIVKIVQGHDPLDETLSSLLDFSIFTPKYTKAFINHIIHPERIEQICKKCIEIQNFSEVIFNIFVQVIISQKPRKSLEMITPVLNAYQNSKNDSSALRQLSYFYTNVQDINTDDQASVLINALNHYISFRDKSQYTPKLSGYQFSRILVMIFSKLTTFPSSLASILKYDPLIFSFLICKECSNIHLSQIPPFSFIVYSGVEVPKSLFMRYREVFVTIINMFLVFSKRHFSNEERNRLLILTTKVLNFVESGPVGRDAFAFVLLHFLRSDFMRKNAEYFFKYIREGESKKKENESNDTHSNKNICRYNAIAILVFSLDKDIFPSTVSLICNDNFNNMIINTLEKVINHFPESPFREKTQSVIDKISGHPNLNKSIFDRTTQLAYQIWKDGFFDSNKSEAANLLINLSQNRSNVLFNEGSALNINLTNINYFFQLALALFSRNKFSRDQIPFYCYIAMVIFPLANTISPRNNNHLFLNASDQNSGSVHTFFPYLPSWHFFSIYRESIIFKMIENINFMPFLARLNEGLPPSLFLGGFLLFSRIIQNGDDNIRKNFSKFCTINYTFLSILMRRTMLYELPEVTREMMRLMEKCPELSIDCIMFLTNTLISTAKSHGYRTFIRFLAPLFRNEHYVHQIIIRNYYSSIVDVLLEFANDAEISTSLSFIYFWRGLGTFPRMNNIEPTLVNLVSCTFKNITAHKNENHFYNALFDLTITHGIQFLCETLKEVSEFSSELFLLLFSKLPKKMINEAKPENIQLLKENKFLPNIEAILQILKSDENKNEALIKWVPWPIDEFIYDVTGVVCSCDLN